MADVRSRFPGLSDGWVRFDGPAGTLPVDTCVDAIADYMRSPAPAYLGGYFEASGRSSTPPAPASRGSSACSRTRWSSARRPPT